MKQIEQDNNVSNIRINEDAFLKLSKRKKILEQGTGHFTGYPSIDMPWLKYYTEEEIMAPIPHMSAYEYLKILNNNNLTKTAIEFLGTEITYKELFKKINEISKALYKIGVKPGEIVTIILPACPEEVYLFYALDLIGACANFVFPGTPLIEVEKMMKEFNSNKLIIINELLYQPNNMLGNQNFQIINKQLSPSKICTSKNVKKWEEFIEDGKNIIVHQYKRNEEEPLFIAKTGGTTGSPKSVVLSDKSFNLQVHQHLNTTQNQENTDRWLRLWPMFSASAAVSSNHLPLCCGMTLVLEPTFELEKMDEIILRLKPSHMPLIASCLDSLIKSEKIKEQGLSFMKSIGCGGEAMTEEFEIKANKFAKDNDVEPFVRIGYGMTENGSGATVRFSEETFELGGTGIPQINTIVSIFDPETCEEKKYGEEGEVCVLSSTFMIGYYNNQEATNLILKKHKDGNTWLHSGDIGTMNENGQLFIKGRIKRVISLFDGQKIYPIDLESIIETIEGIDRAIIIPEADPEHPGFLRPCCFISTQYDFEESVLKKKINKECFKGMPDYIKIETIHLRKTIPINAAGKADMQKLSEEAMRLSKRNK